MDPRTGCVVCGLADARALVKEQLADGERVVMCATHALVYRRSGVTARGLAELRILAGERRRSRRRAGGPADELGALLSSSFARERRASGDRRG